ncbi:ASCH domain-containing protein [Klebsiella pneumoniae]|uniref:ASCH domain-containing protein n=1 Tax=Klebsiella pneumoniae TaxID=573 RepID=UPI0035237185
MGDSPELANELADLIKKGIKTASCGSFASYQQEESAPRIGSYNIILDGQNVPVCVIRLISMQLVRFCDVTEAFALKWFTEFGHLNRGDMLTSEQHRCHNEKKKFQRRV